MDTGLLLFNLGLLGALNELNGNVSLVRALLLQLEWCLDAQEAMGVQLTLHLLADHVVGDRDRLLVLGIVVARPIITALLLLAVHSQLAILELDRYLRGVVLVKVEVQVELVTMSGRHGQFVASSTTLSGLGMALHDETAGRGVHAEVVVQVIKQSSDWQHFQIRVEGLIVESYSQVCWFAIVQIDVSRSIAFPFIQLSVGASKVREASRSTVTVHACNNAHVAHCKPRLPLVVSRKF